MSDEIQTRTQAVDDGVGACPICGDSVAFGYIVTAQRDTASGETEISVDGAGWSESHDCEPDE